MHPVPRGILLAALVFLPFSAYGQPTQGTRNVSLIAHLPIGAGPDGGPVALDQARPLVFAAHGARIHVVDTSEHRTLGAWDTPDGSSVTDLSPIGDYRLAVATTSGVWLVNTSRPASPESAVRMSDEATSAVFAYRHSSGPGLILAAQASGVAIFDQEGTRAGAIALPQEVPGRRQGFRSVYAAYDTGSETDRLYAAGSGGYFVFDITDPAAPSRLTWVNDAAVQLGTGIQATPDATHIVTLTNYDSAPVRVFDLRPALDGTISQVRTAVGAWTANWRTHPERLELRWPYLFVASGPEGLQMVNLRNPFEPYTTAWFMTSSGPDGRGAVDVDVRNRDGLVAISDAETGLWLLAIEDFTSWDGRGWGQANVSSVQDWDHGPVGSDQWQP